MARSRKATQVAYDLAGVITELQAFGITSLNGLAAALNERSVATPRGSGNWTATSVRRVLARLEQAGADCSRFSISWGGSGPTFAARVASN